MFTWAGIKEWGSWALEWGLEDGKQAVGKATQVWA